MALTKVEAAKLTDDMLLRGVIETVVKESSVLGMLPFMQVVGTALTYNREKTLPSVDWHAVGDTWGTDEPTFEPVTASLKILGGDADVDNFLQQTYADPNDLEAIVIESKAKAMAHEFSRVFYRGDTAADANEFDGLSVLVPTAQTLAVAPDGGPLTLSLMDELIDMVKPGRPDALLMSKRTRRVLSELRRTSGNLLETSVDAFGQRALFYDGIPLLVDDFIPDNETQGSGGPQHSSIYAVKFGPGGLMGLENGGIQIETVGELETKDATRHRVKWYCGLALFAPLGVARLRGITGSAA